MNDQARLQQLLNLQRPERESVEVVNQIRDLIERDHDALDLYVEWCHFEANLHWLADEAEIAESAVVGQIKAERKRNLRTQLWSAVACTSLLAGLTVAAWGWSLNRKHHFEPVPQLAGYVEFVDTETVLRGVSPGTLIREGQTIECERGAFRLRMDCGALVVGSGPARLVIHDSMRLEVDLGTVVAEVPRRGFGFVIQTPGSRITDLGTRFGVHVPEDRSAQVHVFEGRVQAANASSASIEVKAGAARSITASGDIGPQSEADALLFNRELIQLAGIQSASDNLRYLESPPASFHSPEFKHQGIFLVLEQRDVTLPATVELFAATPGRYTSEDLPAPASLPSDAVFDSYLIHTNHHGVSNVSSVQIAFQHPVAAVALSSKQLHLTDSVCGHPGVTYPGKQEGTEPVENRGFVFSPEALEEKGDILEIMPDQSTLRLTMSCGFQRIDEIRIFVSRRPRTE